MTTLEFRDQLVTNTFASNNNYQYSPKEQLTFHVNRSSQEEPFIMRATVNGQRVHSESHISYCTEAQFQHRAVSGSKLQEILDGARVPILIMQGDKQYLVGKGFLAYISPRKKVKILFVATAVKNARISNITQVKLCISREIYSEEHKRVAQIVKGMMNTHQGDILIAKDIMEYLGTPMVTSKLASLKEKRAAMDEIFESTAKRIRATT